MSEQMTSEQWGQAAVKLAMETQASEIAVETYTAGTTYVNVVKRAINTQAVELKPLETARREIGRAAQEAIAAIPAGGRRQPKRAQTYRVELQYNNFSYPEIATAFSDVERLAPDTVAFARNSMPDAYRLIRVLYRFINPN